MYLSVSKFCHTAFSARVLRHAIMAVLAAGLFLTAAFPASVCPSPLKLGHYF